MRAGISTWEASLNAVVELDLTVYCDEEIGERGNAQILALEHILQSLFFSGRPSTSYDSALYWVGDREMGVGSLVVASGTVMARLYGSPALGREWRYPSLGCVWLADVDDCEPEDEGLAPDELVKQLGVELRDGEMRMGALRPPIGA